jgi:hypothetical protein
MSTLVEFLIARISEDEAIAGMVEGGWPYRWELSTSNRRISFGHEVGPRGSVEASPARVLAECEAKRYLIDLYSASLAGNRPLAVLTELLIRFAAPYADHPDYVDEWRP